MAMREMVNIDEEKCDGCGLCVPSCAEGAIQIIDGKAKLLSDNLCDGLGACLGDCPQDAITIEMRDADAYDEVAVSQRLKDIGREPLVHAPIGDKGGGCPSTQVKTIAAAQKTADVAGKRPSELRQWPVQLHLVPSTAPFLQDADLLMAADCVPFAYADFHKDMLKDKALLIACPKLDDGRAYIEKLTQMFSQGGVRSLTVAVMEVPCCTGLVALVRQALAASGADIPLEIVTVGIDGSLK